MKKNILPVIITSATLFVFACGSNVVQFEEKPKLASPNANAAPPSNNDDNNNPSVIVDPGFFDPITDLPCQECLDSGTTDPDPVQSTSDNDSGQSDTDAGNTDNDAGSVADNDSGNNPVTDDGGNNNPPSNTDDGGGNHQSTDSGSPPSDNKDSGSPPSNNEDAGTPSDDAGNPDDTCNERNHPKRTCEQELHCCKNACKPLAGTTEHQGCEQVCSKMHKVCVFNQLSHQEKVKVCLKNKGK